MNAAQFSKTFKGTLSRLKPSTRGTINRGINSGIDEINSSVGSGEVMDLGIHLRPDVLKASVIIKLSVSYSVTQMWQRHLICTFILISIKRNGVLTV